MCSGLPKQRVGGSPVVSAFLWSVLVRPDTSPPLKILQEWAARVPIGQQRDLSSHPAEWPGDCRRLLPGAGSHRRRHHVPAAEIKPPTGPLAGLAGHDCFGRAAAWIHRAESHATPPGAHLLDCLAQRESSAEIKRRLNRAFMTVRSELPIAPRYVIIHHWPRIETSACGLT